mmetsp:Transcript_10684/g.39927  ORF Transcript_10684/g.39927 Transcript_10684/m.39927 type:complete len:1214 (-) Transcript_10684:2245-5886(-)|eukprot:CAMPEP_0117442462 /NCGR_PEP_ID=MMETSP0759-20121206/4164_1 /TAXON_ID=63605 /ORGANISM="Percolomonas cosmopolitus, Strain WS" /LENGTH=1213 /DNA_ID=CAMNT_0005234351 /DNA_START=654 /DNA_END=4295 /DNA_ORIENTATION=+
MVLRKNSHGASNPDSSSAKNSSSQQASPRHSPTTTPKKILSKNSQKRVSSLTLQLNQLNVTLPSHEASPREEDSTCSSLVTSSTSTTNATCQHQFSHTLTPLTSGESTPFLPDYFAIDGSLSSSEKSSSSSFGGRRSYTKSSPHTPASARSSNRNAHSPETSPSRHAHSSHHENQSTPITTSSGKKRGHRRKNFKHHHDRKRGSPLQQALQQAASPDATSPHRDSLNSATSGTTSSPPICKFSHHPNSPFKRKHSAGKAAKKSTLSALLSRSASTTTSAISVNAPSASAAVDTNTTAAASTRSPLSASLLSNTLTSSLDDHHSGTASSYASHSSQKMHPSSATTTPSKTPHQQFTSTHSESSSSSSAPRAIPSTGASINSHKSSSANSSFFSSSFSQSKPNSQSTSFVYNQQYPIHQHQHRAPSHTGVEYSRPLSEHFSHPKFFCQRLILSFIRINSRYRFWYLEQKYKKERECFTKPSEIDSEDSNQCDNKNGDLVVHSGDLICDRYFVVGMLGTGTFGVVIKCEDLHTGRFFALKVIKNKEAYNRQAVVEIKVLQKLKAICDVNEKHLIKMEESFHFKNHLCIVFELLNINLYELLVQNQYQGLKWVTVRTILKQMLEAMLVLQNYGILHCDLKPENILLRREFASQSQSSSTVTASATTDVSSNTSPLGPPTGLIKLIDFGSACYEGHTMYSYIQSRFYRSPEVLLGLPYTAAIDMWSLGCIATELFLGLPLFPGHSQHNQVCRIVEILGVPPQFMIENGKFGQKHFKRSPESGEWSLKSEEEYCREYGGTPQPTKRYFKYIRLEDLIMNYNKGDKSTTDAQRRALIHFIRGCLTWNPYRRWTVDQAMEHPLIKDDLSTSFQQNWTPPPSKKVHAVPSFHHYGSGSYGSNSGTPTMGGYYGMQPSMGPSPNFSPYQHVQSSYSPNSGGVRHTYYGSPGNGHPFMPGNNPGSYSSTGSFIHPMAISPQVRPGCIPHTSASYQNFQHQFPHHNYIYQQQQQHPHGSPYQDGPAFSYGSPHYSSQYFSSSYNQAFRGGQHGVQNVHNTAPHSFQSSHLSNHASLSSSIANNAPGSVGPNCGKNGSRKTRPRSRTWNGNRFNKNVAHQNIASGNGGGKHRRGSRPPRMPMNDQDQRLLLEEDISKFKYVDDSSNKMQIDEAQKDRMDEPWEETIFEIEDPISDGGSSRSHSSGDVSPSEQQETFSQSHSVKQGR